MRRLKKGCLVVLEGIDGAGKTTQCEWLAQSLRGEGWDVERLREPTSGPYGRRIRELAKSGLEELTIEEELDLFLKDRRENVRLNIRPALKRGAIVLLDRYYYSTIAYQGARGLDPDEIRRRNEEFAPPADLLLYLSIPAEMAGERIEDGRGAKRDLFEKEEHLRKVKALFDKMKDPQLVTVDATADPDMVFAGIRMEIGRYLDKRALEVEKKGPRILVADDDPDILSMITFVLETMGMNNYREAGDGKEALDALREEPFDLVICDWVMPKLKGIDLLKIMRSDRALKKTPFIMVTAEATEDDITDAIRAGADNYVTKPFKTDDLAERISSILL